MLKKISIFGSTGTIGKNSLEVIKENRDKYKIVALTANSNIELLCEQAKEFNAEFIAIQDELLAKKAIELLSGTKVKILTGPDALIEAASQKCNLVMSAIVGLAGLKPTMMAIRSGANIALANKESLVCAGNIMMNEASQNNVSIIPVDSEHNAIFQIFDFDNPSFIDKIILTASGGPFLNLDKKQLENVTISQAINHPRWKMGAKISVDSATMMNKCLEIIEAHYLFNMAMDQIEVIIHPQSTIHSMVSYIDGSVLAQMGIADMRIPIDFALNYPLRAKNNLAKLNLAEISTLNFYEPDLDKFPSLKLVRQVVNSGTSAQIIMNGANELAVSKFLAEKIKFTDIVKIIEKTLEKLHFPDPTTIDEIISIDHQARIIAESYVS